MVNTPHMRLRHLSGFLTLACVCAQTPKVYDAHVLAPCDGMTREIDDFEHTGTQLPIDPNTWNVAFSQPIDLSQCNVPSWFWFTPSEVTAMNAIGFYSTTGFFCVCFGG